VATETVVQVVA
jgi:hypothetical protein